ncbi:hypothetical protein CKM354_000879800 [Cercospora kikuchii]|uniref:Heterokaryon incompatibility domain-containing protein n=1 Tax=Cercospora kikuchii TaxID=84275 RepID=A0A9P3CTV6_9PEZI|nr:uncharacterized protein CKM354_000879800 [Cercospora kikuchii]GIZ45640.1 hypothetical protein CKM354_000879800 [Cercospora kikuchii]
MEQRALPSEEHDATSIDNAEGTQPRGDLGATIPSAQYPSIYKPLPGPGHIRRLIVRPATCLNAPFECSIEVVPCHEDAEYTALSYAWAMQDGDSSLCRGLYVNSQNFAIRRNLFEALRRLRSDHEILRIWIDAICIDQGNFDERSEQVSNMAAVYKNANRVVAWLGEAEPNDDRNVSRLLQHLRATGCTGKCHLVYGSGLKRAMGLRSGTMDLVYWNPYLCSETTGEAISARSSYVRWSPFDNMRILEAFLGRRYFERRWVLQEISHARHNAFELRWGEHSFLDLNKFLNIVYTLRLSLDNSVLYDYTTLRQKVDTLTSVLSALTASAPQLSTLLTTCLEFRCSDVRDILYSLISIDPSCGIVPNYRLHVTTVSVRLTRYLLVNGQIMTWLLWLSFNRNQDTLPCESELLPSWSLRLTDRFFSPSIKDNRSVFATASMLNGDLDSLKELQEAMQCSVDANRLLLCRLRYLATVHEGELRDHDTKFHATVCHKDTSKIRKAKLAFDGVWQKIKLGDLLFTLPGLENPLKRVVLVLRQDPWSLGDMVFYVAAVVMADHESVAIDGVFTSRPLGGPLHIDVDDQDWPRPVVHVRIK